MIHTIRSKNKKRSKKRIGRGGKRGTYSGKGQKGQKSRAGRKIRPAERDLLFKFPKLRGAGNKKQSRKAKEIHLSDLGKISEKGVVSRSTLVKKGIIKSVSERVKILNSGSINEKVRVIGIPATKKAKELIEKFGGVVENSEN